MFTVLPREPVRALTGVVMPTGRCLGETVEPQQSVWWVQVQNSKGQIGWTDRPADFDGKDLPAAEISHEVVRATPRVRCAGGLE